MAALLWLLPVGEWVGAHFLLRPGRPRRILLIGRLLHLHGHLRRILLILLLHGRHPQIILIGLLLLQGRSRQILPILRLQGLRQIILIRLKGGKRQILIIRLRRLLKVVVVGQRLELMILQYSCSF